MAQMTKAEAGQLNRSAAEIYDTVFVPAMFGQFAPKLADAAELDPAERVLDVACGTGIAALEALARVGPAGHVAGVDINPGMIERARAKSGAVDWREAPAEALPFPDSAFDAVLCQFGLMFLEDRTQALEEMARVTRPGGRIALLVWETLANSPGYAHLVPLLREIAGDAAADALTAPFVLGARGDVGAELGAAGLSAPAPLSLTGTARHPSLDGWIDTEIGGWTLADLVSADQVTALKRHARNRLANFVRADGTVAFPAPALCYVVPVG